MILENFQLCADRRWRDPQLRSCFVNAAGPHCCPEVKQVGIVQPLYLDIQTLIMHYQITHHYVVFMNKQSRYSEHRSREIRQGGIKMKFHSAYALHALKDSHRKRLAVR